MTHDLILARQLLRSGGYTCVLCKGTECRTSTARGVRPLLDPLREGRLEGFCAADKVVGKATAYLYVLLGVRAVYTPVASEAAIRVLNNHGIEIIFDMSVPAIFNRNRTGFCPMESAVLDIEDPALALDAILHTYQKLHSNDICKELNSSS